MPEGHEIRRAADRIAKALEGERADSVWFAFDHLQPFAAQLQGREIRRVEPRGKALLLRFGDGLNIYSHNQLYGRWYVMRRGRSPKTTWQLRLAVHTAKKSALLYSASDIEVLADDQLGQHPFLQRLGPDVLSRDTAMSHIRERLLNPRFRRRSLASLLLDQSFVCGLGNYLRSEILFVSRLDPDTRPADLDQGSCDELADTILRITRRAYRLRGITNDPDEARRLRAEGLPRSDYRHYLFGRANKACRLCGEAIEKCDKAGRRIYVCRVCQFVREA